MVVALETMKPRHGSKLNVHQQMNDKEDVVHTIIEYYSSIYRIK